MALMVKVDEVIHGSKAQLGERSLTAGAPFDVKAWRCIRTRARVVELAWEVRVERQHAALAGAGLAAHAPVAATFVVYRKLALIGHLYRTDKDLAQFQTDRLRQAQVTGHFRVGEFRVDIRSEKFAEYFEAPGRRLVQGQEALAARLITRLDRTYGVAAAVTIQAFEVRVRQGLVEPKMESVEAFDTTIAAIAKRRGATRFHIDFIEYVVASVAHKRARWARA